MSNRCVIAALANNNDLNLFFCNLKYIKLLEKNASMDLYCYYDRRN